MFAASSAGWERISLGGTGEPWPAAAVSGYDGAPAGLVEGSCGGEREMGRERERGKAGAYHSRRRARHHQRDERRDSAGSRRGGGQTSSGSGSSRHVAALQASGMGGDEAARGCSGTWRTLIAGRRVAQHSSARGETAGLKWTGRDAGGAREGGHEVPVVGEDAVGNHLDTVWLLAVRITHAGCACVQDGWGSAIGTPGAPHCAA